MNTIEPFETQHAIGQTSLGWAFVAIGPRGITAVGLSQSDSAFKHRAASSKPADDQLAARLIAIVEDWIEDGRDSTIPLDPVGTDFQKRVWTALRAIPRGETRSYAEIARSIGAPGAIRAVGTACGANPIAFLIPCHRVVRTGGSLGGYALGLDLKRTLLERENALNMTLAL